MHLHRHCRCALRTLLPPLRNHRHVITKTARIYGKATKQDLMNGSPPSLNYVVITISSRGHPQFFNAPISPRGMSLLKKIIAQSFPSLSSHKLSQITKRPGYKGVPVISELTIARFCCLPGHQGSFSLRKILKAIQTNSFHCIAGLPG